MLNKKTINNKDYIVYDNANFSIVIDDYCNAGCDFCVEDLRARKSKRKIENDLWLSEIDKVLKIMRNLNTSISITGGEPTIDPKLPILLDNIGKLDFRKKVITTNGSGLLLPGDDGELIIDKLIKNNFNHLNISRVDCDEMVNQKVMKFKSKDNITQNIDLKDIVSIANKGNLRVRMSCLVNGLAVKNLDDVIDYINFYKNIGVDNIVFRELMNYDFEKAESEGSVINRVKRNFYLNYFVNLDSIIRDINKNNDFKLINIVKGYYYNVWVYDYNGVICCFEKANLENMSNSDNEIWEFVFHPQGVLCGSWNDKEKIILDINKGDNI
jgi:Molybdenum cofactor biosynthesis enzyme